jgi:1-acyl-sn-glycerol-3-phosphate acyltransferase
MRTVVKAILVALDILVFIIVSLPGYYLLRRKARYNYCRHVASFFSAIGMKILGVTITVKNRDLLKKNGKYLLVSNHLSYIDIFILSIIFPTLFVTSIELKKTVFLGLMAALGGSLFVERRSISDIKREIGTISGLLSDGFTICFFPEATSSNGQKVLPFKSSFIESAIKSQTAVVPLCIKYTHIDGKKVDATNSDYVYYYGDMYFFPHLARLVTCRSVNVTITFLDVLSTSAYMRKELCDISYKKISECFFDANNS